MLFNSKTFRGTRPILLEHHCTNSFGNIYIRTLFKLIYYPHKILAINSKADKSVFSGVRRIALLSPC